MGGFTILKIHYNDTTLCYYRNLYRSIIRKQLITLSTINKYDP